jgi:preprotein translocase subunit Sec61beta
MTTAKYRQRVAQTIYEGLLRFFEERDERQPAVVAGVGR